MINKARWLIAVLVCALLATPASCAGEPDLTESDQAQIYAAVIRHLRTEHGGPPADYIMEYTDDDGPGMVPEVPDRRILPESLKEAVLAALAGTAGDYTWVSAFSEVPHDPYFSGKSCQIILGNINRQKDGSVHVQGSLFYGGTGGGGTTWVLEQRNGVWIVTGMTGPIWMS